MDMKPMIYTPPTAECRQKILCKGIYKGVPFTIVSRMSHPCAYVYVKDQGETEYDYDIDCHGGVTYVGTSNLEEFEGEKCKYKGRWIGWDYAHLGDAIIFSDTDCVRPDEKRWTTKEIYEHVKTAIKSISNVA